MNQTTSIVLPIRNADTYIQQQVTRLVDWLPQLTVDFDILIVNDGIDSTSLEASHRLASTYVQVRSYYVRQQAGTSTAAQHGLSHVKAESAIVHIGPRLISGSDLQQLWWMHAKTQTPSAPVTAVQSIAGQSSTRLVRWDAAASALAPNTSQIVRLDNAQSHRGHASAAFTNSAARHVAASANSTR